MTEKEAIETLQEKSLERCEAFGFDCGNCDKCEVTIAYDMAIKALEKQIPKQSKYEDVDNVYGAIKRTCTACGDVCMVSKGAKPYEHYCRQCGQALDWSGDCE